jgi:predicted alpha/beta hydrolase family esterase
LRATEGLGVAQVEMMYRRSNRAVAALTHHLGGRVSHHGDESVAEFRLGAQPAPPLQVTRTAGAPETLIARHPQERGRALLVHGAGGDSFQWLPQVLPSLWAAGYSVCAPTLPGHGRAADPARATLAELQTSVSAAADEFAPTLVVGHSLGGYLVQRHAQQRPVEKLVLLASLPPCLPVAHQLQETLALLHCPLAQQAASTALDQAPDVAPNNITSNVIVIGGEFDRVVGPRWVRDTASRYGVAARFVSGGHQLMLGQTGREVAGLMAA